MLQNYMAIIDLGSNSARLVIHKVSDAGFTAEIDTVKQVLRLSSHLTPDGYIDGNGIQITLDCMRQFQHLCKARQVTEVIGVATAAVRQAKNGKELILRIAEETGIVFRILSGQEEAYYGYLAVVNSMNISDGFTIDIGGGSTEITRIMNRECIQKVSFPFGAVTLTQTFFKRDTPSTDELLALKKFLTTQFTRESWITKQKIPLIAMGGTARNVGNIHQKMHNYSFSSLHQYGIDPADITGIYNFIRQLSLAKRKKIKGLSKDRTDIIVAGLAAFHSLLEITESPRFIVSSRGLRDGILYERLQKDYGRSLFADVSLYSARQLMRRYDVNVESAEHVGRLALSLFAQMVDFGLIQPFENDKKLLQLAALLHDVGFSINVYDTHQHTFYLLTHVLMTGLTHRERLIVALIASFKNEKRFEKQYSLYSDILLDHEKEAIKRMALVLDLSRALDWSMTQQVKKIKLQKWRNGYHFTILTTDKERYLAEQLLLGEIIEKYQKVFQAPFSFETVETPEN